MAVRFKFRSSSTFDSIDIGNKSSISIRDLKLEIVKKKHLNLSQDFDLLFSDSLSGEEYKDESVRIPSGSSVIIKRVPANSTSLLRADDISPRCADKGEVNHKVTAEPLTLNEVTSSLDDLGVNLCPTTGANIRDSEKVQIDSIKKDSVAPRCSKELLVRCHKLDTSLPSQATPKDSSANEGSTLVMQSKPKVGEQVHMEITFPENKLVMERSDMPSELKCSLCRNFFEEAVMIPCCQRSFCEKCIRVALSVNSKCPVCSSTKCKAEDLLPNVSLRQAIERFLESQLLQSENDLLRYAPDGESGIQMKELSFAASVTQKDVNLKRSNQIMQKKLHNHVHMQHDRGVSEDCTEFQGENDPKNIFRVDEEASFTKRGDALHVVTGGEPRNFTTPVRLNRGQRTCYMCGSPDHLIRDCPIASSSRANHWKGDTTFTGAHPGYPQPYWPGTPGNIRPFTDIYGGPSMMMYNTTMPTIPPFAYPPYASSMYSVYPITSGQMNPGVGAPPMGNNGSQPGHAGFFHGHEKQHGNHNGNLGREWNSHQVHGSGIRHDDKGKGVNHSYVERQERMCCIEGGRDLKFSQSDRSTSEKDTSDSRVHPRDDRHEKPYRSPGVNGERRAQFGYDSRRETIKRRESDHRKSDREFHSHSRSSKEQSSSDSRHRREESSYKPRHSVKSSRSNDGEPYRDRENIRYPDDDYGEYYHGHKRKRYH